MKIIFQKGQIMAVTHPVTRDFDHSCSRCAAKNGMIADCLVNVGRSGLAPCTKGGRTNVNFMASLVVNGDKLRRSPAAAKVSNFDIAEIA